MVYSFGLGLNMPPEPSKKSIEVLAMVSSFSNKCTGNKIFFSPQIPIDKITDVLPYNAIKPEDILLFIDDNFTTRVKDCLIITPTHIIRYNNSVWIDKGKCIPISRIQTAQLEHGNININGKIFYSFALSPISYSDREIIVQIIQALIRHNNNQRNDYG
jgi:hypothetical protein